MNVGLIIGIVVVILIVVGIIGYFIVRKMMIKKYVADTVVEVNPQTLSRGEKISVKLSFTPQQSFVSPKIYAKLSCDETVETEIRDSEGELDTESESENLYFGEVNLSTNYQLRGGAPVTIEGTVDVPANQGDRTGQWRTGRAMRRIDWTLTVGIAIPKCPDFKKRFDLRVS